MSENPAGNVAKKAAKGAAKKALANPWVVAAILVVVLIFTVPLAASVLFSSSGAGAQSKGAPHEAAAVNAVHEGVVSEADLAAYMETSGQTGIPWEILAVLSSEHGGGVIGPSGMSGELIEIPEEYGNGGYTVTYWGPKGFLVNGGWSIAAGSVQEKVHKAWLAGGGKYEDGIAVLDGRYLLATTDTFGDVGDLVTFHLEDGTEIPGIIADQKCGTCKDEPDVNEWGHGHGQNVIEFEVDKAVSDARGSNPGNPDWFPDWAGKRVVAGARQGTHPAMTGQVAVDNVIDAVVDRLKDTVTDASLDESDGEGKKVAEGMTPLEWAVMQEGKDYELHQKGPDAFDCSGLVVAAYRATLGIDLNVPGASRLSMAIYDTNANGYGTRVHWDSVDDLQPGDLIFHFGHVGFYAGNGKVFHAAGKTMCGDNGACEIVFQNVYAQFMTMDAIRIDGSAAGAVGSSGGSNRGGGIGLPSFSGGKGRFHLEGDGVPESEELDVQADYVAGLLSKDAPGGFAVDARFAEDMEPYLVDELGEEEKQVRAGWIRAIAGLPIASMDESKAGLVYDAAKRWAMGDVTSAGSGAGETCFVTSWDTGVLDETGDPAKLLEGVADSEPPTPEQLVQVKRVLDVTHESGLSVMKQKALLAAMWAKDAFTDDAADALAKAAEGAVGATSREVAGQIGGQAAGSYLTAAEGIFEAVSGGTLDCQMTTGTFATGGEVALPINLPSGMTIEDCAAKMASYQKRGPRSCSYCQYKYHYGEDFGSVCGVKYGDPQFAVISGTVVQSGNGWITYKGQVGGQDVWIVHCHMPEIDVKVGDTVTAGQRVGVTGIVGLESAGVGNAHAHIEVWPGKPPNWTMYSSDGNGAVDTAKWLGEQLEAAASAAASSGGAGDPKAYAHEQVLAKGWSEADYQALVKLWTRESSWNPAAVNKQSGAYGIPQSLPGSKMADPAQCGGADYKTNFRTQINWGLCYIKDRYGSPTAALQHSYATGWY